MVLAMCTSASCTKLLICSARCHLGDTAVTFIACMHNWPPVPAYTAASTQEGP